MRRRSYRCSFSSPFRAGAPSVSQGRRRLSRRRSRPCRVRPDGPDRGRPTADCRATATPMKVDRRRPRRDVVAGFDFGASRRSREDGGLRQSGPRGIRKSLRARGRARHRTSPRAFLSAVRLRALGLRPRRCCSACCCRQCTARTTGDTHGKVTRRLSLILREELTLQEIGDKYHLSRERIRQPPLAVPARLLRQKGAVQRWGKPANSRAYFAIAAATRRNARLRSAAVCRNAGPWHVDGASSAPICARVNESAAKGSRSCVKTRRAR